MLKDRKLKIKLKLPQENKVSYKEKLLNNLIVENKQTHQQNTANQSLINAIRDTYDKQVDTLNIRSSKENLHNKTRTGNLVSKTVDTSIDKIYNTRELKHLMKHKKFYNKKISENLSIEKDRKDAIKNHQESFQPKIFIQQRNKIKRSESKIILLDQKKSNHDSNDENLENSEIFDFGSRKNLPKKVKKQGYSIDNNISIQNAEDLSPEKIREIRENELQTYDFMLDGLIEKSQCRLDSSEKNSIRKNTLDSETKNPFQQFRLDSGIKNSIRKSSRNQIFNEQKSHRRLKSSIINSSIKNKLSLYNYQNSLSPKRSKLKSNDSVKIFNNECFYINGGKFATSRNDSEKDNSSTKNGNEDLSNSICKIIKNCSKYIDRPAHKNNEESLKMGIGNNVWYRSKDYIGLQKEFKVLRKQTGVISRHCQDDQALRMRNGRMPREILYEKKLIDNKYGNYNFLRGFSTSRSKEQKLNINQSSNLQKGLPLKKQSQSKDCLKYQSKENSPDAKTAKSQNTTDIEKGSVNNPVFRLDKKSNHYNPSKNQFLNIVSLSNWSKKNSSENLGLSPKHTRNDSLSIQLSNSINKKKNQIFGKISQKNHLYNLQVDNEEETRYKFPRQRFNSYDSEKNNFNSIRPQTSSNVNLKYTVAPKNNFTSANKQKLLQFVKGAIYQPQNQSIDKENKVFFSSSSSYTNRHRLPSSDSRRNHPNFEELNKKKAIIEHKDDHIFHTNKYLQNNRGISKHILGNSRSISSKNADKDETIFAFDFKKNLQKCESSFRPGTAKGIQSDDKNLFQLATSKRLLKNNHNGSLDIIENTKQNWNSNNKQSSLKSPQEISSLWKLKRQVLNRTTDENKC